MTTTTAAGRAGMPSGDLASPPASPGGDPGGGVQIANARRELLLEARTDLQCALMQTIPSDDQIIMSRVRSALAWLDALNKLTL